jgi:hypothetical protein
LKPPKKEIDPKLRGYCRLCNRYYFVKNGLHTASVQVNQHHGGVCQERNYACARVNASTAWAEK